MASFRTRYDDDTFYSIMAFVPSFLQNITHSIFFPSTIVMLPFIDEHYLRAIKTRYLWQTRVHIQPLPSPPTKNDLAMNIFVMARTLFSYFWQDKYDFLLFFEGL